MAAEALDAGYADRARTLGNMTSGTVSRGPALSGNR
jgi:hypothetical protein